MHESIDTLYTHSIASSPPVSGGGGGGSLSDMELSQASLEIKDKLVAPSKISRNVLRKSITVSEQLLEQDQIMHFHRVFKEHGFRIEKNASKKYEIGL